MADSDERTKRSRHYGRLLHQTLSKIFYSGSLIRSQIKERIRATDHNSITKLVVELEPDLRTTLLDKFFENNTLLWLAVTRHYYDSAELLVRFGADVNEVCIRRDSGMIDREYRILHLLLSQHRHYPENEQLIRLIIDYGADLNVKTFGDASALLVAVDEGWINLAELFLEKGADVNITNDEGVTPLHAALVVKNADKMVPLLIKYGADIFAKNTGGANVLHYLTEAIIDTKQICDLAKTFIEKGVSLDDIEHKGQHQPIHQAAARGTCELVNLYLDYGANVNAQAINGKFPLLIACNRENPAMLETLLQRGANVNMKNEDGYTALHLCCQISNEQMMSILLSAGADVLLEESSGKTPFASLYPQNIENPSIRLMLKALALKKACLTQSSIKLKDERIIKENLILWNYYQDCIAYISRMKLTRFTQSCSFLEFLRKSHYQIATLMRDSNFEANFGLYDLNGFSMYAEDVLRGFKRAQNLYHKMIEQEDLINEAFDHIFPHMVVRQIAAYLLNDCTHLNV